ncbi:MAG: adenosylcobinamide-phosphate synthase CbiB [Acidimicrobiales bacterium]
MVTAHRARAPRSRVSRVRAGHGRANLSARALAAAAGVVADLALGEPPLRPHPVSAFGDAMARVERSLYRPRRSAGALHAATGLGIGVAAGALVRSTTLATYVAVAQRSLCEAGLGVAAALHDDDLAGARRLLPALVGRDPSSLDASEIARAAVESLAENTVDAVVAPAVWGALFGAPGALGYRAVNTMDASVGYRSVRYADYGWASARLDDLANLVPARLTAALVAAVRPRSAPAVWGAVRRDAPAHPSPNSGVAEAAFAAALGLRLGGLNTYGAVSERRPPLGRGRAPEGPDITRAAGLCRDVTYALVALLVTVAGVT